MAPPNTCTAGPLLISSMIKSAAPLARLACSLARYSVPFTIVKSREPSSLLTAGVMPETKSRYLEFWWKTVRKTFRSSFVGAGTSLTSPPAAGGIGIPPKGLSRGGPPAGARPKAISKARATSAKSVDLPVPGGPDTSTLRERANNFNARLQSSLAIAVFARVGEISVPNCSAIPRTLSVQAGQQLFGDDGVPLALHAQRFFFRVVWPDRSIA